jgi:DNA-binding NarL/FixJ family response regulator
MTLSCLIIDDEQLVVDLLSNYVYRMPTLSLAFSTTDSSLALEFLKHNNVDLVITDLPRPKPFGLTFDRINSNYKVIFVAGHTALTLESLNKNAIDLILKPVSFEGFEKAVSNIFKIIYVEEFIVADKQATSILSRQELKILKICANEELSCKEIAIKLCVSEGTIKIHRKNILKKLNLRGKLAFRQLCRSHFLKSL